MIKNKNNFNYSNNQNYTWDEFYERYTKNFEEFTFYYKDQIIHLITDYDKFLYNIGTYEKGFKNSKYFQTPNELLDKARFNGKKLFEIWNELK